MLNHGGQLRLAKIHYPEVTRPWLDLSTGIAPWSWPVPEIPTEVWQRLPEESTALISAAKLFYQAPDAQVLPVAGSQAAIEKIPTLLSPAQVALPLWGYGEHQKAWAAAGHHLHFYRNGEELSEWILAGRVKHAVVINPNNPATDFFSKEQIQYWQRLLQEQQGVLLVDEAFADLQSENNAASLVCEETANNLIVLRSVGKFFGLAGLRLGFVLASHDWIEPLRSVLPLWAVSHPAQWMGERLLLDTLWHRQQRARIKRTNEKLFDVLQESLPEPMGKELRRGPLFISLFGERSSLLHLHQTLAQQGIWIRFFESQEGVAGLRFGTPDEDGLLQLRQILNSESCRFF